MQSVVDRNHRPIDSGRINNQFFLPVINLRADMFIILHSKRYVHSQYELASEGLNEANIVQ